MKRFTLILAALVLLLTAGLGSASAASTDAHTVYLPLLAVPPKAPVQPVALGARVRFMGFMGEGNLEGVVTDAAFHDRLTDADGMVFTPTGHFAVVVMDVTNHSAVEAEVARSNLDLMDSSSTLHGMALLEVQWAVQNEYGLEGVYDEIAAGATAARVFVWDVPSAAAQLTLMADEPW